MSEQLCYCTLAYISCLEGNRGPQLCWLRGRGKYAKQPDPTPVVPHACGANADFHEKCKYGGACPENLRPKPIPPTEGI